MSKTILHIKNMVCNRCIKVVKEEFDILKLPVTSIELGIVELDKELSSVDINKVKAVLSDNGFELIDDKKGQLVDSIKTLIIEKIHHSDVEGETVNSSDYLSNALGYDYSYLSKLFSSVEGLTIEKYIILQKIEKAKELLVYNELSLKEIAWKLGYSSVQHLSSQFKKITGLTPSHFKQLKDYKRKPLDRV
ncbi:helix-turn-helix domain-containing protein [Carboxylicivirga sediminis]|uniref:Helix-turn-helix domain-containing protein n=1 Tax=Carboxylicivirga sediminis TaxID=2006564 RepID=A0A941F3W5_9BACT|nr:helix-turn-helix domain-containing protein [Carboxylicivirga sediminis]MBR8535489.1 helix-turn-helix domain-containing protein [Carboxylicivirga sediminis]